MVRAVYRSVLLDQVPAPYNRLFAKIYYPAAFTNTLEERNKTLEDRIKVLEGQPEDPKGITNTATVTKSADTGQDPEQEYKDCQILKADGFVDEAATLVKAAQKGLI